MTPGKPEVKSNSVVAFHSEGGGDVTDVRIAPELYLKSATLFRQDKPIAINLVQNNNISRQNNIET